MATGKLQKCYFPRGLKMEYIDKENNNIQTNSESTLGWPGIKYDDDRYIKKPPCPTYRICGEIK